MVEVQRIRVKADLTGNEYTVVVDQIEGTNQQTLYTRDEGFPVQRINSTLFQILPTKETARKIS